MNAKKMFIKTLDLQKYDSNQKIRENNFHEVK